MDKLIDGIQRNKGTFIFILKLVVAASAAFGAGYIVRCGVELANSVPLETTTKASNRRITTVDSLWACPVHPERIKIATDPQGASQ